MAKTKITLEEEAKPAGQTPPADTPTEQPAQPASGGGGGSGGGNAAGSVFEFIKHMKRPVEKIEAPPFMQDDEEAAEDGAGDEPITNDDEGNMHFFDYDPEHRDTAMFFIGTLDAGMGWAGMAISGQPPEKYQKFNDNRRPPEYYVNVTAALVKKYQAKLSLEAMFFSAVLMIYAPTMVTAFQDRSKAKAKEQKQ